MKRLRNVNGKTTYIYNEISFITILHVTTRRQSIAKPPMEDSYGRLHMNIDVCAIKQVLNILHIYHIGYLHSEVSTVLYKGFLNCVGNKLASTLLPLRCLKPHHQRKASCNPSHNHRAHHHHR